MTASLLYINQIAFVIFPTMCYQISLGIVIITLLLQCSRKKVQIEEHTDKIDQTKEQVKKVQSEEKVKEKQDKSSGADGKIKAAAPDEQQHTSAVEDAEKEKVRTKETEEKRVEEIKPKIMKRNPKEERIAKGKETRGKGDYPTMDDVLSDWDSEKDGKKPTKEEEDQKSKLNTNLEDLDDNKKIEQKQAESGAGAEEDKKEDKGAKSEKKEPESKEKEDGASMMKQATKDSKKEGKQSESIKKVDKTAGSQ